MQKLHWKTIQSQDARACLSLCPPISNFVSKRKFQKRGAAQDVAAHQSDEIMLRSLTCRMRLEECLEAFNVLQSI
eukprot:7949476-Karenia_brevis.AAC.1